MRYLRLLASALLLSATACAYLQAVDKTAAEQHASDLLMCQERGRSAAADCRADAGAPADGGIKNCDHEALAAYEACKSEKKL